MTKNSILEQDKFWMVLEYLTNISKPLTLVQICEETNLQKWELNPFLNFLEEINYPFSVSKEGKERVFTPPEVKPNFTLEFSLLEWIQFQAHFPKISECDGSPYHQGFRQKLLTEEEKYKQSDIFSPVLTLENVLKEHGPSLLDEGSNPSKEVLIFLEESIVEKKVIHLKTDNVSLKIFPRKIVYFDGRLNLVAEDTIDKSLLNMSVSSISQCYEEGENYEQQYSRVQIDNFISSLRSMTDTQVRLVLKIYSDDQFSLNLNQQLFENPCLFTNPEGDFIWAASLEPSTAIFEWLCELGSAVEILDPSDFKVDFIKYCEHKLKKLA
jgi:hypothetical protein